MGELVTGCYGGRQSPGATVIVVTCSQKRDLEPTKNRSASVTDFCIYPFAKMPGGEVLHFQLESILPTAFCRNQTQTRALPKVSSTAPCYTWCQCCSMGTAPQPRCSPPSQLPKVLQIRSARFTTLKKFRQGNVVYCGAQRKRQESSSREREKPRSTFREVSSKLWTQALIAMEISLGNSCSAPLLLTLVKNKQDVPDSSSS